MNLRELVDRAQPAPATATSGSVYERFQREPSTLILAVVDEDQRPVGLVERNTFFIRMAAEYGRAHYGRRPISFLMETDFLLAEADADAAAFAREALAERPGELMRGFVAVSDGRYAGVGTPLSLLQVATERAEAADAAEARLAVAQGEAQAAARAKSQFLGVMSHELRTPMNGVLAVAELLHRQPLNPDARAYVQTIIDSSETLLRTLVDDVQALWLPRAQQDGVSLGMSYTGDVEAAALVDPVRLKQVFSNLIGNALKFTRRGGVEASLDARLSNGVVRLTGCVRDTGPGIPRDRLEDIFEPFAREERGAKSGGAGLGLAICRAIVGAMGGRLWAESNPGSGAAFTFEIEAPATAAMHQAWPGAPEEPAGALGAHLLIVDDNATTRMVAETLVGMFGCTCECASDGVEAVEAAAARRFDAVLMDIRMPRMDGVEATRAIRALPGAAGETPIIALTANADPADVEGYLAAGMASVVEKPIKAERLLAALVAALSDSRRDEAAAAA